MTRTPEVLRVENHGSHWFIETTTERVLLRGTGGPGWERALDEFAGSL